MGRQGPDEALTGPEFVDLTLIAFDATLRFDADHDGRLDRAELAEACSVLAHEGP